LPPEFHHAENSAAEADWIATRIESIPGTNHLGRIGILTRTHKCSEAVSHALTQLGIAHLTVEQFDFFRRQEIKDLLARLRLLLSVYS
jgi:DNA helicase-2/ATP-dependent DNA helicase PcrA